MNPYILLAKQAIETFIKKGEITSLPDDLPKDFPRSELAELLERKSGTFVSIFRSPRRTNAEQKRGTNAEKELRGCIGTYLPLRQNIAKEIILNAIAAATEDYRFGPIQKQELPYLSYAVYILGKPELVKNVEELNPQKFGIIVKTVPITYPGTDVVFNGHIPYKSGLLLPDLKGVDTIEKQISIACQKARIDPLMERVIIYKFTVEKYAQ